MSQWTQAIHYLDTASAVFVIFQMLFLVFAYQVGDTKIDLKSLIRLLNPTPRKLLFIGFISGIAVYLLGLPIMLRLDDDIQFVALMADNPFSLRSVGVLVLLIGVVPIATEIGFRGVIFQAMENTTNIGTAVVGSALLFTYIWSVFNFVTALLLGLTTALLYHRYRQLTPGITASVTVTALGIFTLLLKILYGG